MNGTVEMSENECDYGSENLISLEATTQRNSAQCVYNIRNEFKNYFNGIGAVA